MVLHCRQEHSLGKEVFVSALCQFVPIISRTHRLILISKMVATESMYGVYVAFQHYFGITKNFLISNINPIVILRKEICSITT